MRTPTPKTKKPARPHRSAYRRSGPPTGVVIAAVILIALIALVIVAVGNTLTERTAATQPIEGAEQFPNLEQGHTEAPVTYAQIPPAGGRHNPAWQNCGVYTQPMVNENAVHSLEHGAVWITYRPDLPADEVQKLQSLTRQSGYRLLSPYPDLPSSIVVSAWSVQLKLEQADDPRLTRFIQKYELSPLGPEPGAPCTGGVGRPG